MLSKLYVKGPVIGLDPMIPFDANREYTACRICGALFQPELERVPAVQYTKEVKERSAKLQRLWALSHNRMHSEGERRKLAMSGRFLTPEATYALVPFGLIPLSDLVLDGEHEAAGMEAPRISVFDNYQWEA